MHPDFVQGDLALIGQRLAVISPSDGYKVVSGHARQKGLRHFQTVKQLLWCFGSLLI